MKTNRFVFFAAWAALNSLPLAVPALAEDAAGELINLKSCKQGGDTREIEIVTRDPGHVVLYRIGGTVKEVGNCNSNKAKCQEVFDRIAKRLEASGYHCGS